MNVPLSALLYQITKTCDYYLYNDIDTKASFDNIQLYDIYQSGSIGERSIYYISDDSLKAHYQEYVGDQILRGCVFLCYCNGSYEEITRKCPTISAIFIQPKESGSFSSVFNDILLIFHNFEYWDKTIHLSLLHGTSMQQLLDISRPLLSHPMLVLDANLTVIGHVRIRSEQDPYMNNIFETGYITPEMLKSLRNNGVMPAHFQQKPLQVCKYTHPDGLSYYSMCYNLSNGQQTYAYAIVFHCNSHPSNSYQYLMDMLVENLSLYFKQEKNTHTKSQEPYEQLLISLLSVPEINSRQVEAQLSYIPDLNMDGCFSLAQIEFDHSIPAYSFLQWNLKNAFSCFRPFFYEGTLYVLKTFRDTQNCLGDFLPPEETERFLECMAGNSCSCVVSQPFFKLTDLPIAAHQCALSAKYLEGTAKDRLFYYYKNDMLSFLQKKINDTYTMNMLRSPYYQLLHQYDLDHKSDLCYVLYEFLQNGRNVNQTAATLFMHRNTVLNKTKKIFQIFGNEMEDYTQGIFFILNYLYDNEV